MCLNSLLVWNFGLQEKCLRRRDCVRLNLVFFSGGVKREDEKILLISHLKESWPAPLTQALEQFDFLWQKFLYGGIQFCGLF